MRPLSAVLLLAGALLIPAANAGTATFDFRVDTSGIPAAAGGWIDFEFNQANAFDSLSATARIWGFDAPGFTLGSTVLTSTPDVTGNLPGTVVIPNDQAGANYYTQAIDTWGSRFDFLVTLSGDAVGTPAPDGSGFYVFLLYPDFSPIVCPLASCEALNVTIGTDGIPVRQDSDISGHIPEPGTWWLALAGAGMAWRARKRK